MFNQCFKQSYFAFWMHLYHFKLTPSWQPLRLSVSSSFKPYWQWQAGALGFQLLKTLASLVEATQVLFLSECPLPILLQAAFLHSSWSFSLLEIPAPIFLLLYFFFIAVPLSLPEVSSLHLKKLPDFLAFLSLRLLSLPSTLQSRNLR